MKKYLKQFGFVALLLMMIVGVSGCGEKNEPKESNKEKVSQSQDNENAIEKKESKEVSHQTKEEDKIIINSDGSIDNSNWKTYTNDNYGFTMKYPADENEIKIGEYEKDTEYDEGEVADGLSFKCKDDNTSDNSGILFVMRNKGYTLDQLVNNQTKNGEFKSIGQLEGGYRYYKKIFLNNEVPDRGPKTLEELEKSFKKYKKIKQIGNKTVYVYDIDSKNPGSIYTYLYIIDDLIIDARFTAKLCDLNIIEKMIESIEVKK